jgi:hypothetical protein
MMTMASVIYVSLPCTFCATFDFASTEVFPTYSYVGVNYSCVFSLIYQAVEWNSFLDVVEGETSSHVFAGCPRFNALDGSYDLSTGRPCAAAAGLTAVRRCVAW